MLCHSPQYSFNILCHSIQFSSLAWHSKQCITKSLHPYATPSVPPPPSLPPPCCLETSKVRLITILRRDKWQREVCSLLWNHHHGFQHRVHIVMRFHPTHWTLIAPRLALCFDVPERIERAPVFPHNWMIFASVLRTEGAEAQWRCYMRQ